MKKLVIITGASSGIGMELARRFSEQGHPVLMLARRNDIMEKLELPNTICRSVDVTDFKGMESAIREAEAVYGKTDLLVNCAGLMLLVVLGYQILGTLGEWMLKGDFFLVAQDFRIGLPGMLLQVLGGYATVKYLIRK